MRFHLPLIPGRRASREASSCAYTQKALKFAVMMRALGDEVLLYGGSGADEDLDVIDVYDERPQPADDDLAGWDEPNGLAAAAIRERYEAGDYLLIGYGVCQQSVAQRLFPLEPIEYGIGYGGAFAVRRVYESYAWLHTVLAAGAGNPHAVDGMPEWHVIPNFFDPGEFVDFGGEGGYVLFLGRVIDRKGIAIAAQAARRAGERLIVAGAGVPVAGVEYVGEVGPALRAQLLGNAKALLAPTCYVEPFGGVAVEAMLSGTPVLASRWGAFTETVQPGRDGWLCGTAAEFTEHLEGIETLDRRRIREQAEARYSLAAIGPRYQQYFRAVPPRGSLPLR